MNLFKSQYKYIVLIFGFISVISCKHQEAIIPPKDLIDEHYMGIILADFLLIESYNNQFLTKNTDVDYKKLQLYSYPIINEKYKLTDSQAIHSYNYYLNFPDKMKNIITIAQDSLNNLVEKATNEANN